MNPATSGSATSDGALVVAGLHTTRGGGADTWLAAYGADGEPMWIAEPGPFPNAIAAGVDYADGIALDGEDGVVVCGQFTRAGSGADAWVHRYDAAGVVSWVRDWNPGFDGLDRCEAVAVIGSSILAAGGQTDMNGTVVPWAVLLTLEGELVHAYEPSSIAASGWVFAISPQGGEAWVTGRHHVMSTNAEVYAARLPLTASVADISILHPGPGQGLESGHAIVPADPSVRVFGFVGSGATRRGYEVLFGARSVIDAWTWNDVDLIEGATIDGAGNLVLAGNTLASSNQGDGFLTKLDPGGRSLWSTTYDGPFHGADGFADVAVSPDGTIAVTGFESTATQGRDIVVALYAP